jgi:DNA polymerase III subunit delta'
MLIGFEKQKEYFKRTTENGSLSHAYIFSGPDQIGKKRFALEIYTKLNEKEGISEMDSDFKILAPRTEEGERKIYIEDIRDSKAFLSMKSQGKYKFLVIDQAETLTPESSNALLKILEEPPANSILILVTSRPKLILPTISSRSQQMRFLEHDKKTIDDFLKEKGVKKEDAAFLSVLAQGRLGWLVEAIEKERIAELRQGIDDFQKILKQGIFERMQYAKQIVDDEKHYELVSTWLTWIRAYGKDPKKTGQVLRSLMNLSHLISQPQFNHRLAIENFLISI